MFFLLIFSCVLFILVERITYGNIECNSSNVTPDIEPQQFTGTQVDKTVLLPGK